MMDTNDLFNDNAAAVIAELADFFGKFSELLSMELSEDARNIVQLTLCDLLHGDKNDEVTINNDDCHCPVDDELTTTSCHCPVDDELPNEYNTRTKPVETPKSEYSKKYGVPAYSLNQWPEGQESAKMFNGYVDLMDGSNKRITGKRLYEEFKDCTKRYPGLRMRPEDYLKNIIIEELTQIGYDTESGPMYVFLMNICHLDFQKHYFDGKVSDNPYTAETSIKEQFGVDPKLDSLLHSSTTKGHDLSRSALLGLPVYTDGSMNMMNLLSYYCGLISEFMIEAAKDE